MGMDNIYKMLSLRIVLSNTYTLSSREWPVIRHMLCTTSLFPSPIEHVKLLLPFIHVSHEAHGGSVGVGVNERS